MDIIKEAVLRIDRSDSHTPGTASERTAEPGPTPIREAFPVNAKLLSPEELSNRRVYHAAMRNKDAHKAFTNLRTHLIQRTGKRSCSVVVTSVTHGGGTSFVAMNLAAAFASDSSGSAILLDCSFAGRRYEQFGDNETIQGISDYIDGSAASLDQCMTDVGISRLRFLSGGTSRDAQLEYFTRPRAKELFRELQTRYQSCAAIVDAPPALVSANVNVIAEHCDAILLVVPYAGATRQEVQAAARSLPKGKLAGSVFNDVPHWRTA